MGLHKMTALTLPCMGVADSSKSSQCIHVLTKSPSFFKCLPDLETVFWYFLTCMFFEGKDLD